MAISVDTNVIIYSFQFDDLRHDRAAQIVQRATQKGSSLALQVINEFLAATLRKAILPADQARNLAQILSTSFDLIPPEVDDSFGALTLMRRFKLQFFDALLLATNLRGGTSIFLSEDMQDGLQIDSLLILNPFNPANAVQIEAALD